MKEMQFNLSPSFIYYNYLNFFKNNYESNLLKYISIWIIINGIRNNSDKQTEKKNNSKISINQLDSP